MKKISFLIILPLLLLFLISSHLLATTRGIRIVAKSGESLYLYKDCHALVVGVSDYDKWPDLPNATKDAKEVASAMRGLGFTVKTLLDPTSKQLKTAFSDIAFGIGSERNRAVLFYFAGHGETSELADGTQLGYIIPKDCPLKTRNPIGFDDKAISMKEIEVLALKVKSKHFLMLFDSCFSGSLFNLVRAAPVDITEKSARPVRQFITAGGPGEQVPDRSIFKIVFLDGIKGYADLNGDGYVTGSELGMHLQDKVVNYTRGGQHPQFGKINNPKLDKGDFIFQLASSGAIVEEPGRTTLSVECNVAGARVLVDGREVGRTPVTDVVLSPGEHKVRVEKDAYEPYRRSIRLEEGRSLSLFVDLSKETPRMGRLLVDTDPDDARIRILNIKPKFYQGMELEPGRYHVEVSADGYEKKSMWVTVDAGEDKSLNIRLRRVVAARKGKAFTNSIGMRFVTIPAGTFMMGSPTDEPDRADDERQHEVTISKPFYMQTTEVTQGQWKSVMGNNPSYFKGRAEGIQRRSWYLLDENLNRVREYSDQMPREVSSPLLGDDCPVETVSWNDAQKFIRKLNQEEGTNKYRLPTEAEWEYACRAGTKTPFYTGNCLSTDEANYNGNYPLPGCPKGKYRKTTVRVGSFQPNPWGLYEMHGNVWEWCQGWYAKDYASGHVTDPEGRCSGKYRVFRGGSWFSYAGGCRSAVRLKSYPDHRPYDIGFRVARDL